VHYVLNLFNGVEDSFNTAVKPFLDNLTRNVSARCGVTNLGWITRSETVHRANCNRIPALLLDQAAAKKKPAKTEMDIRALVGQGQEGGSTDVGDVSWVVPTLHLTVATSPLDAPWHAWPVVATGGMSIGHKGMIVASKSLAATMVDLFEQPQALRKVRAEFELKKGATVYKAYLPDGPPPVPKD
jgi:metal-dependent amidase/aminoacylase/carboxypeptidase family protein